MRKIDKPMLSLQTLSVELPPRKPNALFYAAAGTLGLSFAQARSLVDSLMPPRATLTLIRIGPALMIGFPCEPTAALGLAAKEMARAGGYSDPMVVALTNYWLAYALTPEQYHKGNYEAGMSFYGDQLGPTLLSALKSGIDAASTRHNR